MFSFVRVTQGGLGALRTANRNSQREEDSSISPKRSGANFSVLWTSLREIHRPSLMAEGNRVLIPSGFPRWNPNDVRAPRSPYLRSQRNDDYRA
jgi:hypothetical protein